MVEWLFINLFIIHGISMRERVNCYLSTRQVFFIIAFYRDNLNVSAEKLYFLS